MHFVRGARLFGAFARGLSRHTFLPVPIVSSSSGEAASFCCGRPAARALGHRGVACPALALLLHSLLPATRPTESNESPKLSHNWITVRATLWPQLIDRVCKNWACVHVALHSAAGCPLHRLRRTPIGGLLSFFSGVPFAPRARTPLPCLHADRN
jgi:hypothetical protein